jgi:hypothetical protein
VESASRNDCNAGDNAALVAVKAAFNNASYFASWTPATKCCHWRGIKCEYFPATAGPRQRHRPRHRRRRQRRRPYPRWRHPRAHQPPGPDALQGSRRVRPHPQGAR